jgi:ribosomal protein S25
VIHSLFGEDAPEAAPQAAPAESVASAANPDAPLADAPGSDDVVLEPARKPKRKKAKGEASREQASDANSAPQHVDAPSAAGTESAPEALAVAEAVEPVATRDVELSLAPEAAEVAAPEVDADASSEPQVEITPARPRSRSSVTVDEIVFKAGCLFVERQRVAVSMLQREFGLDFDAATNVLDQLQRVGLIGPYLGGQRRDILLNMDEWQELVGVE